MMNDLFQRAANILTRTTSVAAIAGGLAACAGDQNFPPVLPPQSSDIVASCTNAIGNLDTGLLFKNGTYVAIHMQDLGWMARPYQIDVVLREVDTLPRPGAETQQDNNNAPFTEVAFRNDGGSGIGYPTDLPDTEATREHAQPVSTEHINYVASVYAKFAYYYSENHFKNAYQLCSSNSVMSQPGGPLALAEALQASANSGQNEGSAERREQAFDEYQAYLRGQASMLEYMPNRYERRPTREERQRWEHRWYHQQENQQYRP